MIFSRMYIQNCLDCIRKYTPDMKRTLADLNSMDAIQSIAMMWEVVIEAELSKLGSIELEKCFKEGYGVDKTPDVLFSNDEIEFLADIKCVSDQDKHDNNRVGELNELIYKHLLELGFVDFSIYINVKNEVKSNRNGQQIELKIPKNIQEVFYKSMRNQLNKNQLKYEFEDLGCYEGLCVELEIKFNEQFSLSHYASYTVSESERATTLYNTLIKNYKQISFFDGYKGFILCDGDYALFKQRNYNDRRQYATFKSTCEKYLREKDKIDFIVGIWISTKNYHNNIIYEINYDFICLKRNDKLDKLNSLFINVVRNFSEILQTPGNAKNRILANDKYGSGSIGCKVNSSHTEKIYSFSMREIQDVLAGQRDLNSNGKYNLFSDINENEIEAIGVNPEIYKEDYYFEIKCSEKNQKLISSFTDYDCCILINDFIDLMVGRVDFNYFEINFLALNGLEENVFRSKYQTGYLIKKAGLIQENKIGFKFDKNKSPFISEFI